MAFIHKPGRDRYDQTKAYRSISLTLVAPELWKVAAALRGQVGRDYPSDLVKGPNDPCIWVGWLLSTS